MALHTEDLWGSEPPELSPEVIEKMSEDLWGFDPPDLRLEVIEELVKNFPIQEDTPLTPSNRSAAAPSQTQELREQEHCFGANGVEGGKTPGKHGRGEEMSVSVARLMDPPALEKILQLKETRPQQLTDPEEDEDEDNRDMAVEIGGSSAVVNVASDDSDYEVGNGQMSKKDEDHKCRNQKRKQPALNEREQVMQKDDVPEERARALLCFLWWLEGFFKLTTGETTVTKLCWLLEASPD